MIRKLWLGNNFPRKLLHAQKPRIGDILAIRLHVVNKRLQCDVIKIVDVHEENIFIDSGITKEWRTMDIK